ncbi:unnamed protein product, partial [Mesorhabditis belari]|uniref:Acyl-CoA dehydrogenase 6 n=1 Tax=Mesorhabditis belari TaxID=2138241 RepID=A0AAF3E9T2_9BILA
MAAPKIATATRIIPTSAHILYKEGHWQIRESIGKFIEREVNPYVKEWENNCLFPAHSLFRSLGQLGVFAVNKSIDCGGLGLDCSYSIAVAEEMGTVRCGSIPMAVAVQSDMATPALALYGSERLKAEFLRPTINGELVSCIAVSELHAGSDVSAIRTRAQKIGDDYVLNGTKTWITNGIQADWACVLASTSADPPHKNKSLFVVPLNSPGVHRSRVAHKLGMHSSDTATLFFENVRVPAHHLIGKEGKGFEYQMQQFQDERLVTIAVLLKPMERCVEMTREYTKERHVFGKPIYENQVVHYRLAELQTEIESLRALLYRAVLERMAGTDVTLLASMGKLKAGRLARAVTDQCLQYWGGVGYTWENEVTRLYRDLRLHSIGAGADEIMLSIISRMMDTK